MPDTYCTAQPLNGGIPWIGTRQTPVLEWISSTFFICYRSHLLYVFFVPRFVSIFLGVFLKRVEPLFVARLTIRFSVRFAPTDLEDRTVNRG